MPAPAQIEPSPEAKNQVDWLSQLDDQIKANRDSPTPEGEVALVEARQRAATQLSEHIRSNPGHNDSPSTNTYQDLWPDRNDLIVLPRSELSETTLGSALEHHGALFVEGLLDPTTAEALRQCADNSFDGCARWIDGEPLDSISPWFHPSMSNRATYDNPSPWRFGTDEPMVFGSDSPRTSFQLLDAYAQIGLREILTAYLGRRPLLQEDKFVFRKLHTNTFPAWHQEAAVFDDIEVKAVNIWLSLDHCGYEAPGLDVIAQPQTEVHTKDRQSYALKGRFVDEVRGDNPLGRRSFEPGDAILFNEMTLHRPYVHPRMNKPRYSVESWFFHPLWHPVRPVLDPLVF